MADFITNQSLYKYHLLKQDLADTPCVLVFPEYIRQNIKIIKAILGDLSVLRPHVKTDKITEIVSMMLDAGIVQFKCATIAEAEMLAMAGAEDILLAYQPTQAKALRLKALTEAYPNVVFSCIIDNLMVVKMLSAVFNELQVYIDVNVGMNRTGIEPEHVPALYTSILCYRNIIVKGLHVYDGHIDEPDLTQRIALAQSIFEEVAGVKQQLEIYSEKPMDMVIAGSPTFAIHHQLATQSGVGIQVSPGTFTLWDAGYAALLPELSFVCSLVILGSVVSIINQNLLCVDIGYKAVSAENPIHQRLIFPEHPNIIVLSQSEEHLVLQVPDTSVYHIGQHMCAIPWHVCPTLSLYDSVKVVEHGTIIGEWQVIARKRKINY